MGIRQRGLAVSWSRSVLGGPGTRRSVGLLLATSSVAALMAGTAPRPAAAACPTNITGAVAGCTNTGIITGININAANVTGNISNTGTISPNGINLTNSTITGGILDSGNLAGGIHITDSASQINATAVGISITGPVFSGGITNAGAIAATGTGIAVLNVSSFGGGISNSGTISSQFSGISIVNVSTFTGGITNSGTITSNTSAGISVASVRNFFGDIVNDSTGTINALTGINLCSCNSIFSGSIINKGTISAAFTGIHVEVATFTGGITNSGTINAAGFGTGIGILVGVSPFGGGSGVTNFVGNILNSGSISGASGIVVGQVSTFTGSITNRGSITATSGVGIGVTAVNNFTGDIVNDSAGTINAPGGIVLSQSISTFSGNIINKGTISASFTGIAVDRVSTFAGSISNSGSITATFGVGISVTSVKNFTGNILNDNAGTINAATGILLCSCNSTFSGSIINKGTIAATGAGIVVEVENFTGGITNSGTITTATGGFGPTPGAIVVTGGSLFSGNIVNSGTLTASSGFGISVVGVSTFAGNIINSGTLTVSSGFGISVVGVSTFAGNIVNSGPLTVSSGFGIFVVGISTFAGSIINSGSLTVTSGVGISVNAVTNFVGDIVNDSSGTINGFAGITLCSCNATFTGNIINKGTITASFTGIALSVGTFTGQVINTGRIVAGGTGIFSDAGGVSVFNSGTITAPTAIDFSAGGGGNTLTLGPGSNITGLVLGTGSDTFQLGGTGTDSFDVSKIGPQYLGFNTFNKVDSATWTLTGSNSAVLPWTLLSGALNVALGAALPNSPFTVQAGLLSVDGTVGAVTINGGALKGNGTLGALTVGPGGTVAPGHSIGQLNVNGPVSFGPGSFYQVEANAAGQADKIAATGAATLAGGTVQALPQGGAYGASTTYAILTAGSGVSGKFAGVTNTVPYLIASLSYDANDAFLTLTRNPVFFQSQAGSSNQRATASALDTLPTDNGLFLTAVGLSGAATQHALDALSGEIHASVQTALIDDSRYMRSAVLDRLRQASYGQDVGAISVLAFGGPVLAYASSPAFPLKAPKKLASPIESRDVTFWAQAFDARAHFDGDGNAAGMKRDLAGFFTGVDTRFGTNWRAGIAAGYSRSDISVSDRASSAGIDTAHLAAYAGAAYGAWKLRTGAAAAWHEVNTNRTIAFPGFFDQATARYNDASGQIFGEVGYGIAIGMFAAEPFGGLAFVHLKTGSFNEFGAGAALAGSGNSEDVGYSSLGLRIASLTMLSNGMALIPRASATWQHAFGDVDTSAALAFQAAGIGYNILGVPLAQDAALVEAGLDLRIKPQITFGVGYSGELAGHVQDHAVKGKFLWAF
jgi:outer membrane autotransporter protein